MNRISYSERQNFVLISFLALSVILLSAGCKSEPVLKKPAIAVNLPEKYNTPDGMVLDADNNIILCCPNLNDTNYPAKLLKITPDDKIEEIFTFPPHPETGRTFPLGIDIGPDGSYYIADNQSSNSNDYKSRLLRIVIKDGRLVRYDVLVTGFIQSNAVVCRPDGVYVTETSLDVDATPMPSGVYRFEYSEFTGRRIKLLPGGKDEHLIATLLTDNQQWPVGANGMTFDDKGNMYVGNFGEASLIKITFDKDGKVASQTVFAKAGGMESADGVKFDAKTASFYIADFVGNSVNKVDARTGRVTIIAKNENNSGGVGGLLDRPSEVCFRGNKMYVSNIDLPLAGNVYDKPHTISVIDLGK